MDDGVNSGTRRCPPVSHPGGLRRAAVRVPPPSGRPPRARRIPLWPLTARFAAPILMFDSRRNRASPLIFPYPFFQVKPKKDGMRHRRSAAGRVLSGFDRIAGGGQRGSADRTAGLGKPRLVAETRIAIRTRPIPASAKRRASWSSGTAFRRSPAGVPSRSEVQARAERRKRLRPRRIPRCPPPRWEPTGLESSQCKTVSADRRTIRPALMFAERVPPRHPSSFYQ